MAWAAIPAFFKTRFNANEILTSLMLTYVATLLLSYLVHGPLARPRGLQLPGVAALSSDAGPAAAPDRRQPPASGLPLFALGWWSRLGWVVLRPEA